MQLRPAQEEILEYQTGRLAVSAVPGSGKTFTLSLLAARLIASGRIQVAEGQRVLIVTYLNASVENFRAQIRRWLQELELPLVGFDVRTLHSLGLEVVRTVAGSDDEANDIIVLDESQSDIFLKTAVNNWIDTYPQFWRAFLPDESLTMRARWRDVTERTARTYIRTAKNLRFRAEHVQARLNRHVEGAGAEETGHEYALLWMLNGIYTYYQAILNRQGALDFDDLIWQAVDLVERRPDVAEVLRLRWPYVLEDEAQDSVPLQEDLLRALTGEPDGNWVRVGDPNQAITSTFTAADPRFFTAYMDARGVRAQPLPNSGRSAPLIFEAANSLLHWVTEHHPVPEVREHTFRPQDILPTPVGDAQPNPPDSTAGMRIRVYKEREVDELPSVARLAWRYAQKHPDQTLALLVPTNRVGFAVAEQLDALDAAYDNLLRGGSREREIAAALQGLLALLADPLDTRALVNAHRALLEIEHPIARPFLAVSQEADVDGALPAGEDPELERFYTLLRSVHRPEMLLFPGETGTFETALPEGVATPQDVVRLEAYVAFLRRAFEMRALAVDDLTLALADELFASAIQNEALPSTAVSQRAGPAVRESDLSIAYQIASVLRNWRELHPEWRLPELAAELADVASGRRALPVTTTAVFGYEPQPGRITLATQHGAKGLEWDAVFLVGIDGFWIPSDLEAPFLGDYDFLGGDPAAEAAAQLRYLMAGDTGVYPGRSATESAHIEVISERLRLLYVGITRARRYLHISRSQYTRFHGRQRESGPALVLGVLHDYLQQRRPETGG